MTKELNLTGLLAILVLLIGSLTAGIPRVEKAPRLTLAQETWDFGPIKQGQDLTHNFTFKNSGDAALEIDGISTSCGCTAALASKSRLEPGESGEIRVTFSTAGYEGQVSKFVYIESNDPDQPRKRLTVTASIDVPPRPKIELGTYSLDLGLILEGEDIKAQTSIQNQGERELTVSFSHRDAEFFVDGQTAKAEVKIPAGKDRDLRVTIPAQGRQGLIREYVLIRSNDAVRPNLSLYLSGYIVSKAQLKELFSKYRSIVDR